MLKRIGHQSDFVQDPIVPAIRTYGYRNKLEFSFGETEEGPRSGSTGQAAGTRSCPSARAC